MKRIARYMVLFITAIVIAGAVPQADAQVVVRVGHRHHHRHAYYRHGHRYYR